MEERELYSFSKLDTFNNCKRCYYYTYVCGERGGDNIYSFLGTIVHNLIEKLYKEEIDNLSAINEFNEAIDDAEMLGLNWISDKIRTNFVECVVHYLENFIPIQCDEIHIEDYFEVIISGCLIRGYIDMWYVLDDEIYIVDFKTSSKFSAKDLIKKQRQLLIYAKALQEKYPDKKIWLCFDMVKYAYIIKDNGRLSALTERNKISILDDFENGIVRVECSDELKNDIEEYVLNTVTEKDSINMNEKYRWGMAFNPHIEFFCQNLCGFVERCQKDAG